MNEKWLKYLNLLSLPIQMVVVMMGYFVIEAISRHSVGEAYIYMTERPLVFLYNSFLIFTTTLIVYLVRRRVFEDSLGNLLAGPGYHQRCAAGESCHTVYRAGPASAHGCI